MTTKSESALSPERREEIERECGSFSVVHYEALENDVPEDQLEASHLRIFCGNPTLIAAYVDAKVREAVVCVQGLDGTLEEFGDAVEEGRHNKFNVVRYAGRAAVESAASLLESAFAKVRAEERERCAEIAQSGVAGSGCGNVAADRIAAAIRKGGSHES